MKQKFFTFTTALIIYGLVFGTLMYFSEAHHNLKAALFQGVFFGTWMALFGLFIQPRIKNYFEKRRKMM